MENKISLIFILLIVVELVFMIAIADPDDISSIRYKENNFVISVFGRELADKAMYFSVSNFQKHFIDSGVQENVTTVLRLDRKEDDERENNVHMMPPGIMQWMSVRAGALWSIIFGIYHRSYIIVMSIGFFMPIFICCAVDSLVMRRINIDNKELSNAVFYHGAKKSLYLCVITPILFSLSPFSIHPLAVFCWLMIFSFSVWMSLKNVQELV